jgi:hypothetical protein
VIVGDDAVPGVENEEREAHRCKMAGEGVAENS